MILNSVSCAPLKLHLNSPLTGLMLLSSLQLMSYMDELREEKEKTEWIGVRKIFYLIIEMLPLHHHPHNKTTSKTTLVSCIMKIDFSRIELIDFGFTPSKCKRTSSTLVHRCKSFYHLQYKTSTTVLS